MAAITVFVALAFCVALALSGSSDVIIKVKKSHTLKWHIVSVSCVLDVWIWMIGCFHTCMSVPVFFASRHR